MFGNYFYVNLSFNIYSKNLSFFNNQRMSTFLSQNRYRNSLLFIIMLTCFGINNVLAQISVTPHRSALQLATKLTGPGVSVFNATLNCADTANGIFVVTSSNLGLDSGIVLTSGIASSSSITGSVGVNVLSGHAVDVPSNFASYGNGTPGDPQLDLLLGSGISSYDACILEFDFRPVGDTVRFQYVFGSEEYTNFTCSNFNDVFAFFISGHAYGTGQNIALVPGTTIPVCINSVNCGATGSFFTSTCAALGTGSPFCSYYVNNDSGTTVTYDGFTSVLSAVAAVTPCDTYHLKIAIADASDDILDSGVFLKAGSLRSNVPSISSNGLFDSSLGSYFYCIRDCNPGEFIFNIPVPQVTNTTIHYTIGGTATNGVDYTTIIDSVIIPAGTLTDTVHIHGLSSTSSSGTKILTIYLISTTNCSGVSSVIDSAKLLIVDSLSLHILTPDTAICINKSVDIRALGTAGAVYSWSPGATLNDSTLLSPIATPNVGTIYTLTETLPNSGCPSVSRHLDIEIQAPPPSEYFTKITCVGTNLPVNIKHVSDSFTYTYLWTPATYLNNPTVGDPIITPTDTGTFIYSVLVSTSAGCFNFDTVTLISTPGISIAVNPMVATIKYGEHIQLNAINNSIYELLYMWIPDNGTLSNPNINNPVATPTDTTLYTVIAMNSFGCTDTAHVIINIDYNVNDIIPTAFTPNGDGLNDIFRVVNLKYQKLIDFRVFNRWGQQIYQTINPDAGWDGNYKGEPQDPGVYYYMVILGKPDGTQKYYSGDVTLIR